MECYKWEEHGLLYSSGELDQKLSREFEEHLKECEECRKELYFYREEKNLFFTADILGVAPSPAIDAEILRVCSDIRRKGTGFTLMPVFLRKALMPVALFALAFVSVGYIMLNMENAHQMKSAAIKNTTPSIHDQTKQPVIQSAAMNTVPDSLTDSVKNPKANFAKSRGNLDGQGVIPVDLKNK